VKKTTGVLWGRFNPPHKGHIALIRRLAKRVDALVIAVGNSETSDTMRDPFSGVERVRMMKSYLREQKIVVKDVVAVADGDSWTSSVDNLFEKCGSFDVLFTDHKAITRLVGTRAKVIGFKRHGHFSSTLVRDSIAEGGDWESMTGSSVASLIKRYGGVKRIRRAYSVER